MNQNHKELLMDKGVLFGALSHGKRMSFFVDSFLARRVGSEKLCKSVEWYHRFRQDSGSFAHGRQRGVAGERH
jgi:hypothetical protein